MRLKKIWGGHSCLLKVEYQYHIGWANTDNPEKFESGALDYNPGLKPLEADATPNRHLSTKC